MRAIAVALLITACTSPDSADSDPDPDSNTDGDSDPDSDAFPPGSVLFAESFDDADFASRGWYDDPRGAISTDAFAGGGAFECVFEVGATSCLDGKPARRLIADTESVYVSIHVRYSANWVGSGRVARSRMPDSFCAASGTEQVPPSWLVGEGGHPRVEA